MEGVERLVDHIARIALEIVKLCCARSDIRPDDALATIPELAVGVIPEFHADIVGVLAIRAAPGSGYHSAFR